MNFIYTILGLIIITFSCSPCQKFKLYNSNIDDYSYNIDVSNWEVNKGAVGIEYFAYSKESQLQLKIMSSKNEIIGTPKILNKIRENFIQLEAEIPLTTIGYFESDSNIKYSKYKAKCKNLMSEKVVDYIFYEFHNDNESFGFLFSSDKPTFELDEEDLDKYMNCLLLK